MLRPAHPARGQHRLALRLSRGPRAAPASPAPAGPRRPRGRGQVGGGRPALGQRPDRDHPAPGARRRRARGRGGAHARARAAAQGFREAARERVTAIVGTRRKRRHRPERPAVRASATGRPEDRGHRPGRPAALSGPRFRGLVVPGAYGHESVQALEALLAVRPVHGLLDGGDGVAVGGVELERTCPSRRPRPPPRRRRQCR